MKDRPSTLCQVQKDQAQVATLCESCEREEARFSLYVGAPDGSLPFSLCRPCADDAHDMLRVFSADVELTRLVSPYDLAGL